ncbi:uncharacterized protein F5147DRAFT_781382 [Suillus discolor]|uniref:Uncharacterized protein n=1 Tax=Suillus discolor TaxID=1912936 RepID=A0A9P7EST2_9AGAM|nr:uncharacterized protein F5147DRAFT_781382 [Suillus discolor]KAG2087279.1 hypothetical protein F5147DRAFT_781382 [Suillus discolor]
MEDLHAIPRVAHTALEPEGQHKKAYMSLTNGPVLVRLSRTFPNRSLTSNSLNFDFNNDDVGVHVDIKASSSRFALFVNRATVSLFEDCCALNADGTLKDASEITFFNDPDDEVPLPQPSSSTTSAKDTFSILLKAGRTPATVAAGSRRSGRPSKPSARIRDVDNACGLSSSTNPRKRALSSATDHPPRKKTAMRILSPLDSEDEEIPSTSPLTSLISYIQCNIQR